MIIVSSMTIPTASTVVLNVYTCIIVMLFLYCRPGNLAPPTTQPSKRRFTEQVTGIVYSIITESMVVFVGPVINYASMIFM